MLQCWCGNRDLTSFGPDYMRCQVCETLVSKSTAPMAQEAVSDDESDFYGKQYWLGHQQQDLGHPDIFERARHDLAERNLHWLKALLKYALPPAKVMELGCSHGSFVALLTQAGYEASGVEMSPWVVELGQKTFEVPIHVGPVENLSVLPQSLDVIAMMDVLEHLDDPIATMRHCMSLLKPGGLLLIQTPEFQPTMRYEALIEEDSPFLIQLKFDEHLYLFSQPSVTQFLKQIGAEHVYFEPAIFSHYDMFLVASKTPLTPHDFESGASALQKTANGRLALSMIDLRDSQLDYQHKLDIAETDRAARLDQIHILTDQIKTMQKENASRKKAQQTFSSRAQQVVKRLIGRL